MLVHIFYEVQHLCVRREGSSINKARRRYHLIYVWRAPIDWDAAGMEGIENFLRHVSVEPLSVLIAQVKFVL